MQYIKVLCIRLGYDLVHTCCLCFLGRILDFQNSDGYYLGTKGDGYRIPQLNIIGGLSRLAVYRDSGGVTRFVGDCTSFYEAGDL